MAQVINTTFRLRRGLAEVWTRNNPILQSGEPGFEMDTYRLKIGDGATAWNDLAYFDEANIEIAADGLSLVLSDTGVISLAGFEEAQSGQVLRKTETGIEWVTPTINELAQTEVIYFYGGSATDLI